jgi:hypothetical protein
MEINEHAQPTEPSLIVLEIRARMAQLDRVDEIVSAIDSMRKMVGFSHQPLPRRR